MMKFTLPTFLLLAVAGSLAAADDKSTTFQAYVDSDICSHLMLGPITPQRSECSKSTFKDGSDPVLVRLKDNFVFEVNKTKMLKEQIAGFVEATGEAKEKDGKMKLESVKSIDQAAAAAGDGKQLLDVRLHKLTGESAKVAEKVRHELAMMPYISEYDFISFSLMGDTVILSGWTVRITNRSTAENIIKKVEGVARVVNNIEVLPMGRNDMQIRADARMRLQRLLSRYFWGSGSAIKIVVKNGDIILLGTVATKSDSDVANIQCNSVPNAFKVFNLLKVEKGS